MAGQFRYEVIIYWSDEDHAFIAEVPELPGCAADGTTYQEAVSNAEVVIQEWLETARELGRSIPEPKGRLMHSQHPDACPGSAITRIQNANIRCNTETTSIWTSGSIVPSRFTRRSLSIVRIWSNTT